MIAEQERRKRDTQAMFDQKQAELARSTQTAIAAANKRKAEQVAAAQARQAESKRKAQEAQRQAEATARQSAIDVRNMNVQSNAVSSSLRLLSKGPRSPGPTAQQSKPNTQRRGAKTTSTGLRMGSQASTTGTNIAT